MTKRFVANQIVHCFYGFENPQELDTDTLLSRVHEVFALVEKYTMKQLLFIRSLGIRMSFSVGDSKSRLQYSSALDFAQRASDSEFTKRTSSE